MAQSLYEKYGGFAAAGRIVLDFYERALDSEEVGHHFDGVDMARLIDHQTKFIAFLLGGPAHFTDDRLRAAHRGLGVTGEEFAAMSALLGETLADHGVSPEDAAVVLQGFEARRGLVVL